MATAYFTPPASLDFVPSQLRDLQDSLRKFAREHDWEAGIMVLPCGSGISGAGESGLLVRVPA